MLQPMLHSRVTLMVTSYSVGGHLFFSRSLLNYSWNLMLDREISSISSTCEKAEDRARFFCFFMDFSGNFRNQGSSRPFIIPFANLHPHHHFFLKPSGCPKTTRASPPSEAAKKAPPPTPPPVQPANPTRRDLRHLPQKPNLSIPPKTPALTNHHKHPRPLVSPVHPKSNPPSDKQNVFYPNLTSHQEPKSKLNDVLNP